MLKDKTVLLEDSDKRKRHMQLMLFAGAGIAHTCNVMLVNESHVTKTRKSPVILPSKEAQTQGMLCPQDVLPLRDEGTIMYPYMLSARGCTLERPGSGCCTLGSLPLPCSLQIQHWSVPILQVIRNLKCNARQVGCHSVRKSYMVPSHAVNCHHSIVSASVGL